MRGDIKLEENQVIVEATTLACHSTDIVLDHPARRKSSAGVRRALVHDFDDGLTLNWNGDFPNGVTVNGKVRLSTIAPGGTALRVETADLELDRADRRRDSTPHRRALVHDFNDGLTINWNKDYPGGVNIEGKLTGEDLNVVDLRANTVTVSGLLTTHKVDAAELRVGGVYIDSGSGGDQTLDLVGEIKALREELDALKAKIAALESKA